MVLTSRLNNYVGVYMCTCVVEHWKTTTLIYKNITGFFSFPLNTKNAWMGLIRESTSVVLNPQGPKYKTLFVTFTVRLKSSLLYNIPDAHANFRRKHLFQPATDTIHGHTLPSCVSLTQFTWYLHRYNLRSAYFRYQENFLLFSFN